LLTSDLNISSYSGSCPAQLMWWGKV